MKKNTVGCYVFFLFSFLLISFCIQAQQSIRGKILSNNHKPLSSVSIAVVGKAFGYTSDVEGNFEIPGRNVNQFDTLLISSIGYKPLKIPASRAISQNEFLLSEESKMLEEVKIKNYINEGSEGSIVEKTGYFRGWATRQGQGEIGRMIYVKNDEYLVDRVRFKLNSQCDTCIIRLHIRSLTNGLPDEDLLKDSVSIIATRHGFDDKYIEFDLKKYNLVIKKKKYVFVSLETLNCYSVNGNCSLAYIGTEPGSYLYRTRDYREWQESTENSLYLKMYYRF